MNNPHAKLHVTITNMYILINVLFSMSLIMPIFTAIVNKKFFFINFIYDTSFQFCHKIVSIQLYKCMYWFIIVIYTVFFYV